MNGESSTNQKSMAPKAVAQSESSESSALDIQKRQFESACEAFRAGKEEGSEKAREKAPSYISFNSTKKLSYL